MRQKLFLSKLSLPRLSLLPPKSGDTPQAPLADYSIVESTANRRAWEALMQGADFLPLEQTGGYGDATQHVYGIRVRRHVVYQNGLAVAAVQSLSRAGMLQILRGPVWLKPLTQPEQLACLKLIRKTFRFGRYGKLFWWPELPLEMPSHLLMRKLGLWRCKEGYSTSLLDLSQDQDSLETNLHSKWRNQLRKSQRSGLQVQQELAADTLPWLIQTYKSFKSQAEFAGPSPRLLAGLLKTFMSDGQAKVLLAKQDDTPVAGIVVLCHGNTATYYAGVTTPQGRQTHAHNLLLWEAALLLKAQGLRWLDLGGTDSATMPGVTRFKERMGGETLQLCGVYW